MNKTQFLESLKAKLSGLPRAELEERLLFYSEMIDDRIEEGLTEEEAVAEIGSVEEIAAQIMAEIPLSQLVSEKVKQGRQAKPWEILLLVLGFPVWLPLLICAFAVVLSLYLALWAILISLWAVDLSLAALVAGDLFMAVRYLLFGDLAGAGFMLGAAILCAGLCMLLFFGCIALTKVLSPLAKRIIFSIKAMFIGKEFKEK